MVMADRQTNSIWSHMDGDAFEGTMTGSGMEFIPLIHTTWEEWQSLHPDTTVLSFDTDYQAQYRSVTLGMPNGRFAQQLLTVDDRLQSEALVLGVMVEDAFTAYPVSELEQTNGVINETVAGIPIVVFYDASNNAGIAFSRLVEGEETQFELVPGESFLARDSVSGTLWNFEGRSFAGDDALKFVTSYLSEWYGWSAYHPATTIYALP
jgi:hypothetical protein